MRRYLRWPGPAAFIAVALLAPPGHAADEWTLLGSRRVSFRAERDVIEVGLREGLFNAIKIEVHDGDLEMYNIRLTFGNGDTWSPNTRLVFREESRSRTIDLPGEARFIRRVEFWYRSRLGRGQATVRVFAREVGGRQTAGPPGGDVSGWEHLGMRQVDFRVDHDVITAARQGRFRSIRIVVEGGDLELFDVRLTFGDGETFSPATRFYFREDSRSRTIDLPGGARIIRRMDFFYRSVVGGGQGKATVHVYGHT